MAIKYYTEMKTAAPAPVAPPMTPTGPEAPSPEGAAPAPDAGASPATPPAAGPSKEVNAPASPEKDAIKFKLKAEQKAKEQGFAVRVTISSSNKSMRIDIDPGDDIVTQRDALKLAVALDAVDPAWHLMDEPLQKAGSSWGVKISKVV